MSDVDLIRSSITLLAAAHKILSSCYSGPRQGNLDRVTGLDGIDSVGGCLWESRLSSELEGSVSKNPNWILPLFSNRLRSFIPDKSFYLAAGMNQIS